MNNRIRILFGLIPAMLAPFVGALLYFVVLSGTRAGWVAYSATKVFALVWPLVAMLGIERQIPILGKMDLPKHVRAIPMGALSGLVIAALMLGLYEMTALGDYVRLHSETIRGKVREMGLLIPYRYLLFGVFVSLLHSLLEEYYWRWFVFGRLSKISRPAIAYGLAGFAFAAHHYVVLSCYFPALVTALFGTCVGIGGGFWCWLYRKQESLVGCWISHLWVDVAIFYVGYKLIFS
jgi:hypothetical protein